uniref:SSD domain-containing protein n=1 Tax=Romanomermis culicivorax TaxID=13658 RepID=A0A915L2F8_ROMCU
MCEAAVSITVTVLTDVLSFATGLAANIPAVIIFSLYTTVAVIFSFIYQLTFSMGLLVLALRMEERGGHSLALVKTVPVTEAKHRNIFVKIFALGSRPNYEKTGKNADGVDKDFASKIFQKWYGPVLMHPIMRTVVMIWFCIYLGLAGWACSQVQQGLEPVNLLVSSSYAIPHYRALEKYFWNYGAEAQVCVNNAPNMADPKEKRKIFDMVDKFANSPHGIGQDSVQFWLKEFEFFLTKYNLPSVTELAPVDFYLSVYHFLALNSNQRFRLDVKWDVDMDPTVFYENYTGPSPNITAFRFTIGLKNFKEATMQIDAVESLRSVAAQYPEYNITTFNPLWLFVDQYEQIWPNVLQEIVGGTLFMILIALLLIPHPVCSLWVAVVILSVDVGVIGFMTVWGIRLDTVSMITIIMSIGFSVDFAAHMAHAYVASGESSPVQRIYAALGSIGWPALQGGLSTVLGVCVLANLDSYMIVAFFKTVFLVIVLALLHGLVFLPVLLSIFVPQQCKISLTKKNKTSTTTKNEKDKRIRNNNV